MSWRDPAKTLAWMMGFRITVIGLAVAALGLAWLTQQLWLAILALIIGGEETLESTLALAAMRSGNTLRPRP